MEFINARIVPSGGVLTKTPAGNVHGANSQEHTHNKP